MPLSWNEIKSRAVRFSKEWENETDESAESQTFLNDFFYVFGITRRRVASFEKRVHIESGREGYIDLLWKGIILIEHKTRGKNLDKAHQQAIDYFPGLKEEELPKYILVSDFARFRLYNLEENTQHDFVLKDLVKNVKLFSFIAGYQISTFKDEDPVNIKAAEKIGRLHDKLKAIGYEGHFLEIYLVRIVFCLFADDTNIFNKGIFEEYIKRNTKEDGSDLAHHLSTLFFILNQHENYRLTNLDESLAEFPYVNGKLFAENLPPASFDSEMRTLLLDCCMLNWSKISPAIFGSMFQAVMNPEERRNLGAHYTSEKNILKVIKPLFLDELHNEFESVKNNRNKLAEFHKKLATLKFLDPACGCGNFLVITYRELRLLELEIIRTLLFKHYKIKKEVAADAKININQMVKIEVDQFYGIEIEEWPARISEVAMWLIDHQMNIIISEEFGEYFVRLPLKKTANIINDNALRIDWQSIIPKERLSYILGNPPFSGKHLQDGEQKKDMDNIFIGVKGSGVLDYVTCWYIKASHYIQNTNLKVAFVSTNSISQGEQVGVLWNELFNNYKIKIHFAHRTFKWSNEARGKAAVHVVIIGFAYYDTTEKYLFEYDDVKAEPHLRKVSNINPYLIDYKDILIQSRRQPICNVPVILFGSKPTDGGNLILSEEEKNQLLLEYPDVKKYIHKYLGSDDLINNVKRWCLWLVDADPSELNKIPPIIERIEKVRKSRLESKKLATRKKANTPAIFAEIRHPGSNFLAIPLVSSENRKYIPIAFYSKDVIGNQNLLMIGKADNFHFGILTSEMHMSWVKYTCGRMKSDFSYSNTIVYNNFPWPKNPTEKQIKTVEEKAQKVLDVRKEFPESSLADLYDPLTMPLALVKAHQELDKAVDLCYRPQPFPNETKRIEFLFELYEKYTNPLLSETKKKKRK
ncbi:MAG: class I SAM-dependent DNA methyltransferase [Ignavibacteria bacterium]|nr:class I SAM-dependent DNA methyltransferase [Ignavibacteria bacterium]